MYHAQHFESLVSHDAEVGFLEAHIALLETRLSEKTDYVAIVTVRED